jgi:hypothetical protein
VPHKRGSQFGASGAKLFGCASGDIHGRASEIDISSIDGIALGVLSDFSTADVVGANAAGLQTVGGVAARLAPVVRTPFTQLILEAPFGSPQPSMDIETALKAVGAAFRPWGARAAPSFVSASGLPNLTDAAGEDLDCEKATYRHVKHAHKSITHTYRAKARRVH